MDALTRVPPVAWWAVAGVVVLSRLARRLGMWAFALFALPGTTAHEFAHFLVALLLGGRPQMPRLWPQRTPDGWRLGAVAFRTSWWRAGPVALAPLLLLPAALAWTVVQVAPARGAAFAVHAWIAGTLVSAAMPSRTDLRLAAPLLAMCAALALAVAATVALR